MARTTPMRLVELIILKQDISKVLSYLGKNACFQFQSSQNNVEKNVDDSCNEELELLKKIEYVRSFLSLPEFSDNIEKYDLPTQEDFLAAKKIVEDINQLQEDDLKEHELNKKLTDTYDEALAFNNLKTSYSDLEHLSFLSIRVGKIDPSEIDSLKFEIGDRAVIVQLGNDKSKILAASSKKGRFALDTQLAFHNFIPIEIPKDFKGIPDDVFSSLKKEKEESDKKIDEFKIQKKNYSQTHSKIIYDLLGKFSLASQVRTIENKLESTKLVYRLTGWIPLVDADIVINELDKITQHRIAIRKYNPEEVPSVINGKEKVPVELKHGKFISSFKRMIFSYGSPLYGTIDPTPFVALFFTLLFGIMFGDAGQGLVFLLLGILMALKIVKVGSWNKFAPVFMAIGVSSMIMGVLTGEFFATEGLLEPFSHFVTGFFGTPRKTILDMKFWNSLNPINIIFGIFGFTMAVGFVINSVGLIINILNKIAQKKLGSAFFGKTGLFGALFFWYIVGFAIFVFIFGHKASSFDFIIIGVTLFFAAFGEPFERFFDGHRPVLENGIGSALISGVVELIEVISTYLSNSISFVRVGAFALAHAVLGYIIATMSQLASGFGQVIILIVGNIIVIVLEGMIVAIQVIRLQYYEFFSKFFNETGREFKPFAFNSTPDLK